MEAAQQLTGSWESVANLPHDRITHYTLSVLCYISYYHTNVCVYIYIYTYKYIYIYMIYCIFAVLRVA